MHVPMLDVGVCIDAWDAATSVCVMTTAVVCNRHTASTSGGNIFAIAAAVFLVLRIIFELQQQQLCMCA